MMKTGLFGTTLCFLTLFSPADLPAEVYQWTDARGVIHLTDNLHSVPEPVRSSPGLVIRKEIDTSGSSEILLTPDQNVVFEPVPQPQSRDAVTPSESEKPAAPVNIVYSPQQTVVVINSTVIHPRKPRCHTAGGCQGTFRPNPADRRYIHPSAFSEGSRQFIQPELSSPARR